MPLPAHAQADVERVVVGAAADPAVVAQVDLRRRGDGGGGLEADHGSVARRRGAEHGEAVAGRDCAPDSENAFWVTLEIWKRPNGVMLAIAGA